LRISLSFPTLRSDMEITITLTQEQTNSLLQLIDIAIKAGGYQNAKVGVPLADIILAAAQPKASE
jgi:hypothetical protein